MSDNIVKLVFKSALEGDGWENVSKKLNDLLKDSGKLSQGINSLSTVFGTAGISAGKAIGMLLQGGIWGFAAEGIKLIISKIGLFNDKSEEVKKTLEDQKEASDRLNESISTGYKVALEKIDAELKKRKELIELTKRQSKAQLEIVRAQKIMSGDMTGAQWIENELSSQDKRSEADKADADVYAAEKRVKEAQTALAIAQKTARMSSDSLERAEQEYLRKSKPVNAVMQSSAGAYVQTSYMDSSSELAAVKAAQAESEAAEAKVDAARKALETELQGLRESRKTREVIRLENEAADKKAIAEKRKSEIETEKASAKTEQDADRKFFEDAKKHALEEEDASRERAEKNRKEEEQKAREDARKDIAEQSKKRMEAIGKEAEFYRQRLEDAHEAVQKGWSVYRDPSQLDQAAERRSNRQEKIDEARFEKDAERLQRRKDWRKAGNLSNRDRATRDILLAKEKEKKSKDHLASIDNEIKDLIKKIEEMSSL